MQVKKAIVYFILFMLSAYVPCAAGMDSTNGLLQSILEHASADSLDSVFIESIPVESIKTNSKTDVACKEFSSTLFKSCLSFTSVALYSPKENKMSIHVRFMRFSDRDFKSAQKLLDTKRIGNHAYAVWNCYTCHFIDDMLIIVDSYTPGDSRARHLRAFLYSLEITPSPARSTDSLFCLKSANLALHCLGDTGNFLQILAESSPVDTTYVDASNLITGKTIKDGNRVTTWLVDTSRTKCKCIIFPCPEKMPVATVVGLLATMLPDVQKLPGSNNDLIKCQYNYTLQPVRIFSQDTKHASFIAFYGFY